MSEELNQWTPDLLYRHIMALMEEKDKRDEQRFEAHQQAQRDAQVAQEKAVNAALQAAQQAVTKAETAAEKRFDSVNEFRASLADQAANLMPRSEATVLLNALTERMQAVEKRTAESGARSKGLAEGWGYLVALVTLIGAVVAVIIAV